MKSLVVVVVDRSGSMDTRDFGVQESRSVVAEKGIKKLVSDQQALKVNGKTGFCLVQFDSSIDVVYSGTDIKKYENTYRLIPRGNTRLWDAIDFGAKQADAMIAKLRKRDKPKGVIFVVVTDGAENASREQNQLSIKALIERKKSENWDFTFLCNDPMVVEQVANAGFQNTARYAPQAMNMAYDAISSKVSRTRSAIEQTGSFTGKDAAFTENEIRSFSN